MKRDQEDPEKKAKSGREKRILRTSREERGAANERETGRRREEEEEKRSETHRSDGDVGECSAKGQVVKMKMIEKMKR